MRERAKAKRDAAVLQVSMLWGDRVMGLETFARDRPVRIGSGPHAAFTVHSESVGPDFALARMRESTVALELPRGADVSVREMGAAERRTEALRACGRLVPHGESESLWIGLNEEAVVKLAANTFVLRPVAPSTPARAAILRDDDYTFFKITSFALTALIAVVAAVALTPPIEAEAEDVFSRAARYEPLIERPARLDFTAAERQASNEGERAAKPEGRRGKEDTKPSDASSSKTTAGKRDVSKVGLLGALGAGGGMGQLLGGGGLSAAIDEKLSGLKGATIGDQKGIGGLGSRGNGNGGGGDSLSIGGLGTQGDGPGRAPGGLDFGTSRKETVRIQPGKTLIEGGMDRDLIAQVVRRHQSQIKHCYDSELQRDPNLSGKIAIAWTIDPAGQVADATVAESSMGNATVEQCILARVRRWNFPEPKGGGVVAVTFPWVFKSAGSGD